MEVEGIQFSVTNSKKTTDTQTSLQAALQNKEDAEAAATLTQYC